MSNPEVNEFNSTVYISYIDNDYTININKNGNNDKEIAIIFES